MGYSPYGPQASSGGYSPSGSGSYSPYGAPPVAADDGGEDDGGVVGILHRALWRSGSNVRDIAHGAPAGIVGYAGALGRAADEPFARLDVALGLGSKAERERAHSGASKAFLKLNKEMVTSVKDDLSHPLRNPVYTLADVLPILTGGSSAVLRLTAAQRAARAGESASKALLTHPSKTARIITAPTGKTARGHYSRSGLGGLTQRAGDATLQKAAARGALKVTDKGSFSERWLEGRISKWDERHMRVQQAVLDTYVNRLVGATAKLTPVESRALRMAFEKLPAADRISAARTRAHEARLRVGGVPGADRRTVSRLDDRAKWEQDALQHLDVDSDGIPSLKLDTPEGQRLGHIMELMQKVYGDRETILKAFDIMDEAALDAAKLKTGRFVLGAHWVQPTAARVGRSPSVLSKRKRAESLQRRFDKLYEHENPGTIVTKNRRLNRQEAEQYLAELNLVHDQALKQIADASFGPVDMREVSRRNRVRGKEIKKVARVNKSLTMRGFGKTKLSLEPTVWDERFADAQRMINDQIDKHPDHPVMRRWAERQEEMARLEEALSPDPEEVFGMGPKRKREPITVGEEAVQGTSYKLQRLGTLASNAKDELATAEAQAQRFIRETGVVGAEDLVLPEGAGHIGYPRQARVFPPRLRISSTKTGGHARDMSMRQSFGEAIRYGLDEPNVGKILASRGHAANKLKMLARRMEVAREGGTSYPTRVDDVFLWDDGEILSQEKLHPETKGFLAEPENYSKTAEEAEGIVDRARALFMRWSDSDWHGLDEETQATLQAATEGKGVFVHRKVLGDFGSQPLPTRLNKLGTIADTVNNIQKSLLIYLKLNYPIVQALSNTAMIIIQQGFAAPVNIARAGHLMRTNPELAAMLGDVMGTGALMQLAGEATGAGKLATASAKMTQNLAHWMSSAVDGPARLSAIRYEAEKAGFKTDEQLYDLLTNPEHADKLGEVAQRAKESIVDYSELGDTERNLIRRIFFVYPWLKGSTKWTAHFLRDHPIQASVLSQASKAGNRENAELTAGLPSYLRGSFLARGGLVNPAGVNPLQTPLSIADAIYGTVTGDPVSPEAAQFLTPAYGTLIGLATHRNTLGSPVKGNLAAQLRQLLLDPTYLSQVARAGARTAGADVNEKGEIQNPLIANLLGPRTQSASFPNPNDPYWRFVLGGLYPRDKDDAALRRAKALEESGR